MYNVFKNSLNVKYVSYADIELVTVSLTIALAPLYQYYFFKKMYWKTFLNVNMSQSSLKWKFSEWLRVIIFSNFVSEKNCKYYIYWLIFFDLLRSLDGLNYQVANYKNVYKNRFTGYQNFISKRRMFLFFSTDLVHCLKLIKNIKFDVYQN